MVQPQHISVLLLLLLVLGCCSHAANAQQQKTVPVAETLSSAGYTSFVELARAGGIAAPEDDAVLTILAPTNAAIDTFLARMNLTLAGMKGRPALSAAVVAYHVLPRIKGKPSDVQGATRKQPLVALSADNTHVLRFWMEPGSKVMMEDMQGNTAMLLTKGVDVGANIVIYGVDRVLMSGDTFFTIEEMLAKHPQFKPLRALFEKTGLDGDLKDSRTAAHNSFTVFAPTAAAIEAAKPKLDALSTAELKDVLRYHVVRQPLSIPAGLLLDTPYDTEFSGHSLKFKREFVPATMRSTKAGANATRAIVETIGIVSEAGVFGGVFAAGITTPTISIDNIIANRVIVHGINAVLRPHLSKQQAAAKPPAAGSKPAGRALLQSWRGGTTGAALSAGMTGTQAAIRAAVEGRTNTYDAAIVGSATASAMTGASGRCWNCGSRDLDMTG